MTNPAPPRIPWGLLDDLTDAEYQALAESALSVLREEAGDRPLVGAELPASQLRQQLTAELAAEDIAADDHAIDEIVTGEPLSRQVSLAIIGHLGEDTALRDDIEKVYQARRQMMVLDGGVLTGAALLLLATKLKRARVQKGKLDVQFYKANSAALDQIKRIIGGG
jgi:hypothetical protein